MEALKTLRIVAAIGAVLMFWLVYVLFALQLGSPFPYGIDLVGRIIVSVHVSGVAIISLAMLVSCLLAGIILLDYALTGKFNL